MANKAYQTLQRLIANPSIPANNKLRVTAIYALRYNKHPSNSTPMLLDLLAVAGNLSRHRIAMIPKLIQYHNSLQAAQAAGAPGLPDLFQSSSFLSGARDRFKGLKGVENVYTQHSPRLENTLQDLIKGKLREALYPFVEGGGTTRDKPQDIVVFMVGGTTYEEAKMIAQVNASSPGVRVVLGGTCVHNSASFLEEVEDAVASWPEPAPTSAEGWLRREINR
jgi:vacuolar protein sorting-associated protein 45